MGLRIRKATVVAVAVCLLGGLVGTAAALIALNISPRPGTRLIRYVFEKDGADVKRAMVAHAPGGISSSVDQPYRSGDDDARLDVYFPETVGPDERLPTVVWTHGGAWISGHKDDAAPYFQLIAAEGYAVASVGYSMAPGATYPTPIHQVNDALAYIQQNAARFHVDPDRIVLAGDSAGAQITSQIAALVTKPSYAAELGLTPSLVPPQLRGAILFCGIYDMNPGAFSPKGRQLDRLLDNHRRQPGHLGPQAGHLGRLGPTGLRPTRP